MDDSTAENQTKKKPDQAANEEQLTKKRFLTKADIDAVNKRWDGIRQDQPLTMELAKRVMRGD